jgi:membrane-associated protein
MELLKALFEIVMHLDKHLDLLIRNYGIWTYAILFFIIFFETGFVVTPFLPGDSLLFAGGTFAALGSLDARWLIISMSIAAIAGDTVNYWIGYTVGSKVFNKEKSRFLNKEYLYRTHRFYEKYGGKTIILARFIPIIRTFAPFVAGIGSMTYRRFILYNISGGIAWVVIFVLGGYLFGNIPVVKQNFSLVIFVIIILSILPGIIEFLRHSKSSTAFIDMGFWHILWEEAFEISSLGRLPKISMSLRTLILTRSACSLRTVAL